MYKPPQQIKKGWIAVSQANNDHPKAVSAEQIVEVMAADGDTRIGPAKSFSWGWTDREEIRITQYRMLSVYAQMTADELLAFIAKNKADISQHEAFLAGAKLEQRTALNELNRRLQDTCDVSLNDVMQPSGAQPR